MSNTNFKPGDRVQVVKEYVFQLEAFGGYILNSPQESGTYAMRGEVQPLPPFKRGDVVVYKPDPHAENPCIVLACFFDQHGNALFVDEKAHNLHQCNEFKLLIDNTAEQ